MSIVRDVMTDSVVTVRPTATIDRALALLIEHQVSGLPVVGDEGELLGVITEFDIIDLVYHADIETAVVGDYMTRDVHAVDPEASLDDPASIFCTASIRRVPVVSDGRLVGIVSRHDLLRFVHDVRQEVNQALALA